MTDVTFILGLVPSNLTAQLKGLKVDRQDRAELVKKHGWKGGNIASELSRIMLRAKKIIVGIRLNQAETDLLAAARKAKMPIEYVNSTGDIHTD
jgi:hypothetical protein